MQIKSHLYMTDVRNGLPLIGKTKNTIAGGCKTRNEDDHRRERATKESGVYGGRLYDCLRRRVRFAVVAATADACARPIKQVSPLLPSPLVRVCVYIIYICIRDVNL